MQMTTFISTQPALMLQVAPGQDCARLHMCTMRRVLEKCPAVSDSFKQACPVGSHTSAVTLQFAVGARPCLQACCHHAALCVELVDRHGTQLRLHCCYTSVGKWLQNLLNCSA